MQVGSRVRGSGSTESTLPMEGRPRRASARTADKDASGEPLALDLLPKDTDVVARDRKPGRQLLGAGALEHRLEERAQLPVRRIGAWIVAGMRGLEAGKQLAERTGTRAGVIGCCERLTRALDRSAPTHLLEAGKQRSKESLA